MRRLPQPRAIAFALAFALGCRGAPGHIEPPARATAAAPAQPAFAFGASADCCTLDPGLHAPELVSDLRRAVAALDLEPPDLEIERIQHPVAYAYTALLRYDDGDRAGSAAAARQIHEGTGLARCDPAGGGELLCLLSLVRSTTYYADDGQGELAACSIFEWHPAEAFEAFGVYGASVVDSYFEWVKNRCLERLLTRHGSAELTRSAIGSMHAIIPALYDVTPHPFGTGYSTVLEQIEDMNARPMFVPRDAGSFYGGPAEQPIDPEAVRADAARYIRDLDVRIARFEQAKKRATPAIAEATCDMGKYWDVPLTPSACQASADSLFEHGLWYWLSNRPYAELHWGANGELIEPKPWR